MRALSIKRFPNAILKQPTRKVKRIDKFVHTLIDSMIKTMCKEPNCVGLAAPQVGSSFRVAVMDVSLHPKAQTNHGLLVLVNPRLDMATEPIVGREGCLSVPDFTGNVKRANRVRLKAQNEYGLSFETWLNGFEAVVAQHEVDHLNGKLFLDRVANNKRDLFRRKTYL